MLLAGFYALPILAAARRAAGFGAGRQAGERRRRLSAPAIGRFAGRQAG